MMDQRVQRQESDPAAIFPESFLTLDPAIDLTGLLVQGQHFKEGSEAVDQHGS